MFIAQKRGWLRVLLAIVCVSGGIVAIAKVFAGETTLNGTVSKIIDGDTIHFRGYNNGATARDLTIRMVGMDAPETHFPTGDGRVVGQGPWGEAATAYLTRLIPVGTPITLRSQGFDKYHRVLGRLFFENHDANLQMIRAGWAIPYIICAGPSCDEFFFERENVANYLKACELAREQGRGIFSPDHPLREMPFEFRLRMANRRPDKPVGDFRTRRLFAPERYDRVDVCNRIFFMNEEDARRAGYR